MGSCESGNMGIDNSDGSKELFVGFIQFFSNNTAKTLKCTMLVQYPVQCFLLTTSAKRKQSLIITEHTLMGFLPTWRAQELLEGIGSGESEEMSLYEFTL